jgi:glycine/D-amino acid oxidase-like deaminating enzyme
VKATPYWWETVPARSQLQENIPSRADVAVVGGGYTGLAAARQLARAGASVVVFEAEHVGWGASSRNGGQVLTGLRLDPGALVRRFGEARAREWFEISRDAIRTLEQLIVDENIECEYARTGHLQAAWKPSHFKAFAEEQVLLARVFGHRVDLVSREQQRSEIGSDVYHGLLVDERSGALNPAQYVAGLHQAATRAGAKVFEAAAVIRVRREGSDWTIESSRGPIRAHDVLVATDSYTGRASPALRSRLVSIGSYVIATEPLPPCDASALLPKGRTVFDSKHFLYYFRLTRERRLLFGGRAEFSQPTDASTRRAADILRRGMTQVFPQLADVRVEYAWSGNVGFTRDQMPHAGRLDGLWCAGGYCGHGIAMATHLGSLVGRRMAGEPIDHPLLDDRWPTIPLYSGVPLFLPLVGAYYKLRDAVG